MFDTIYFQLHVSIICLLYCTFKIMIRYLENIPLLSPPLHHLVLINDIFCLSPASIYRYSVGSLLGTGAFAKCYELISRDSNTRYAGKLVPRSSLTSVVKKKLISEIRIHRSLVCYRKIFLLYPYFLHILLHLTFSSYIHFVALFFHRVIVILLNSIVGLKMKII